jgi:hypothetical protein
MTSTERRPDGAEGPTSSPAQIIAPEHHHGGPSAVVQNGTSGTDSKKSHSPGLERFLGEGVMRPASV